MTSDAVRELCAELADLYDRLGDAVAPDRAEAPDPSSRMRPALLWCTAHKRPHRRDEWETDACAPGQDPRRASVLMAPALTATAPRYSVRRRVPTSSAPLDVEVLSSQRAIGDAALMLAREARHALGDLSREHDPMAALARLPMLLGRLDAGHPVVRRALGSPARDGEPAREGILARRRRAARYALELERRPVRLAPCPSDQLEEYVATYSGGPVVTATWVDRVCRDYDAEASLRASLARREAAGREVEPVEVWRRSRLFVRDPEAPPDSDAAAYRCPGCGRVWRTAAEKRGLYALLAAGDVEVDRLVAAARGALLGRLAAAMRRELAARGG